jgi:hypothetical protein
VLVRERQSKVVRHLPAIGDTRRDKSPGDLHSRRVGILGTIFHIEEGPAKTGSPLTVARDGLEETG